MSHFRDRPLTWLFIVATILVDVTQLPALEPVQVGLDIGQLSAVAVWAVMSGAHRLARSGVFLAVVSLVAGRYASPTAWFFPETTILTVLVVYAVCVVLATCPLALFRHWNRSHKGRERQRQLWQFPLVELFGWTIIVAYASFACRFLNIETIWQVDTYQFVLAMIPIAFLAALILENSMPAGYWFRVIVFVTSSLMWILCIATIPLVAPQIVAPDANDIGELLILFAVGCGYLVAWYTLRMLDQRQFDMATRTDSESVAQ